ncbi:hypothetical protein DMENIID0001_010230 [Sergentomyia squamirostris]
MDVAIKGAMQIIRAIEVRSLGQDEWKQASDIRKELSTADNWETEILKLGRQILRAVRTDGESLSKILPFEVEEALNIAGEVEKITRKRDASLQVVTKNAKQAERLIKVERIGDVEVKISPDETLNTCKGMVQGVTNLESVKKRVKGVQTRLNQGHQNEGAEGGETAPTAQEHTRPVFDETPLFMVSFNLPERPSHLKIGYVKLPVKKFVPEPLMESLSDLQEGV